MRKITISFCEAKIFYKEGANIMKEINRRIDLEELKELSVVGGNERGMI